MIHAENASAALSSGELLEMAAKVSAIFVASYARPAQPKRSQNQRLGFQIEIKEKKTPGDEHYLDPPGAELLAWSKN
jgi:hypothetical protein